MWHYAAEMFVTWSSQGDEKLFAEKKKNDTQLGEALLQKELLNEKITIDLSQTKEGDWLRIKDRFLSAKPNTDYPLYYYGKHGKALYEKFSQRIPNHKNPKEQEIPLIVSKVDKKWKLVYFMPRGITPTLSEMHYSMFAPKNQEPYHYILDANMVERFAWHHLQTLKTGQATIGDLLGMTDGELKIIEGMKLHDLINKYSELTLKELIESSAKSNK